MKRYFSWLSKAIFGNTINLLAWTIVLVAFFLTFDWYLIGVAGAFEVLYLSLASCSRRFAARLAWQELLKQDPLVAGEDPFLDRLLLVVAMAGFATLVFFGFGKHLLNHPLPNLTHAAGWEAGAIAWTGMFSFYYACKFQRLKKRWNVFGGLVVAVIITLCLVKACSTMSDPLAHVSDPLAHVLWIGAIVVFLAISDCYMAFKHTNEKERRLSRASFFGADVPTVVAFFFLWLFLLIHKDAESRDVFVSGVITFQLLFSNAVFIVMEFDIIGSPTVAPKGGSDPLAAGSTDPAPGAR